MPGYSYQLNISGFDKLATHFQRAPEAMRGEVINFLQAVASGQTAAIQTDFDTTITSRTGKTRGAIQPFVNIGARQTLSAGTHQDPITPTIKWLNWGTGLYGPVGEVIHIEARNAKALHFFWKGHEYFRKSVNVKGIKPRAFIEHGVMKFQGSQLPEMLRQLQARLAQVANETGWK